MHLRMKLEEGWSTLILLWMMILVSAMAIVQADLISGLHVVTLISSAAVLAGLLFLASRIGHAASMLLRHGGFPLYSLVLA